MHGGTSGARRRTCLGPVCAWLEDRMPRVFPSRAREETRESRGMPCLFLNTERVFGRKTTQKSGFRRHLAGSKMPKETFFTAISRWRMVSRRARCLGFLAGVAAVGRPRSSATATMQLYFRRRYLVAPGDGVLRKAVQAERQPYSGALLQHLEAQPVGLNELGLHIRHPAYRPDPTSMPRVFGRGSRSRPVALVSDRDD